MTDVTHRLAKLALLSRQALTLQSESPLVGNPLPARSQGPVCHAHILTHATDAPRYLPAINPRYFL